MSLLGDDYENDSDDEPEKLGPLAGPMAGPMLPAQWDVEEEGEANPEPAFTPPGWAKMPVNRNVRLEVHLKGKVLGMLPINEEKFVLVGSDSSRVNVEIEDASVAPIHAVLINSSSKTFLQVLSAENVTLVDGERVLAGKPLELSEGQELSFGKNPTKYVAKGVESEQDKQERLKRAAAEKLKQLEAEKRKQQQKTAEPTWSAPPFATLPGVPCELRQVGTGAVTPLPMKCCLVGRISHEIEGIQSLVVNEGSVSRRHAAIVHCSSDQGDMSFLYDLASMQGTFVDGEQLEAHEPFTLTSGCEITFGAERKFVFKVNLSKNDVKSLNGEVEKKGEKEKRFDGMAAVTELFQKRKDRDEKRGQKRGKAEVEDESTEGIVKQQAVAYDPLAAIFGNRPKPSDVQPNDSVYTPGYSKDFSWSTKGYLR